MDDSRRSYLHRRQFAVAAGGTAIGLAGCLARFRGFNEGEYDIDRTDLFVSGEGGYTRYRIPSLLTTSDGTVLAICEARKGDGADRDPVDLVVRRSTDGGETWGEQRTVYAEDGATIGNPTAVVDDATGAVHLAFCRNYRDVFVTRSDDDGQTWAPPTEITSSVKRDDWGYYATGPGVGIQLQREPHAGRLVVPATYWTYLWEGDVPEDNERYDFVLYSDDGGETWDIGETVGPYVDEPQAVELDDGRVVMNMRNAPKESEGLDFPIDQRAITTSADGGDTWSAIEYDETLITPTCQASIVRYSWPADGKSRILFANPARTGGRGNLTIRLSYDECETWEHSRTLYGGRAAYSCLTTLPDGSIGCLFERGDAFGPTYKRLTFSRVPLAWLTRGADTGD